ncbi:hypothetical protein D3C71_1997520 [compost metagenome]
MIISVEQARSLSLDERNVSAFGGWLEIKHGCHFFGITFGYDDFCTVCAGQQWSNRISGSGACKRPTKIHPMAVYLLSKMAQQMLRIFDKCVPFRLSLLTVLPLLSPSI